MAEIVVLRLSAFDRQGVLRELADADTAQACLDQFGDAVSVERVSDAGGVALLVTCAEQRGPRGAYRLHAIACDHRIPVHIQ